MSFYSESALFSEAEESADEFYAEKEFCMEDILADYADHDARRIMQGETTGKATAFVRSFLRTANADPQHPCYQAGGKYYDYYCKLVRDNISASKRASLAIFPDF